MELISIAAACRDTPTPRERGEMPYNVADRDIDRRSPLIHAGTCMLAAAILAGGQPTGILATAHSDSALYSLLKDRQDLAMISCVVSFGIFMNERRVQLMFCAC